MLNEQEQLRFMRLWTAAQPAVSGYVRALVRDREVADEVLQETSLVLFRRFDEYDEQRPFVAWALGIAKFQVLSLNRDAARSRVAFDTELLVRFTETWGELAPGASDRSLFLQDCIQRLTARARQMARLRYYDELTAEEIARQIGGSGAAVRVALQRIRQQLRDCVERQLRAEGETP
jgi:RNA polymerase sigma-70 factor (ECF subfamily)